NAPDAYERLIGDALRGDATYFAHWDEVELSWRWVQPILEAFESNLVPLHVYAAGTNGPAASDALLAADGFRWLLDEEGLDAAAITPQSQIIEEEGERYVHHAHA